MQEEQWRSESFLEGSVIQETPKVKTVTLPKTNPLKKWAWVGVAVFVLIIAALSIFFIKKFNSSTDNTKNLGSEIKIQEVNVESLTGTDNSIATTQDQVVINGQLQANSSILLKPTDKPDQGLLGQLFVDKSTNQLTFFNGNNFSTFVNQEQFIILQANLLNNSGGVSSLQGIEGDITLTGINGIGIISSTSSITVSLPSASAPNLCLISTSLNPVFSSCSNGSVASLNGLSGVLNILNSSGSGVTITLDDASTVKLPF
ncbi:MAG: hypothetical protein AAB459_01945 [Patescibacteria group bacterium]